MYKIANALIIDDKVDLTFQNDKDQIENREYQSLRSIQKYFLKNSIPFSVINQISQSFLDALEIMKNVPKPDLVVLDLDLDSDGYILDSDRNLIRVILKQLHETFGPFILLIYSSQIEEWSNIKSEILEVEASMEKILANDNVIVMEKFYALDATTSEKLGTEIIQKGQKYFQESLFEMQDFLKSNWNNEVAIVTFFFITFILIIYLSYPRDKSIMFVIASIVILLTSIVFIVSNQIKERG
jgi:hypothetical protein